MNKQIVALVILMGAQVSICNNQSYEQIEKDIKTAETKVKWGAALQGVGVTGAFSSFIGAVTAAIMKNTPAAVVCSGLVGLSVITYFQLGKRLIVEGKKISRKAKSEKRKLFERLEEENRRLKEENRRLN